MSLVPPFVQIHHPDGRSYRYHSLVDAVEAAREHSPPLRVTVDLDVPDDSLLGFTTQEIEVHPGSMTMDKLTFFGCTEDETIARTCSWWADLPPDLIDYLCDPNLRGAAAVSQDD
jgi:hypothetical protein